MIIRTFNRINVSILKSMVKCKINIIIDLTDYTNSISIHYTTFNIYRAAKANQKTYLNTS
ncbi:hypothetical protein C5S42_02635 [Candidatus Methanomarinus sp.]|nr:hypothetical protein C5S42_02635 [ANME-2 cluster archaeon]